MDERIEAYLGNLYHKIIKLSATTEEMEDYIKFLDVFFEIELIDYEEYVEWKGKIAGSLSNNIDSLELSNRAYNSLKRVGVNNKLKLRNKLLEDDILGIRGIGVSTAVEIIHKALNCEILTDQDLVSLKETCLKLKINGYEMI